jgi:protein-S-isoprenylcysteine O-methyltransferase Ste14
VVALVYALHLAFWAPFVIRGRIDRAAGRGTPGPAAHRAPGATGWLALHTAAVVVMYLGIGLGLFAGGRRTLGSPAAAWAASSLGVLAILAATALVAWTMLVFRSWRLRAELDDEHELCTSGPFRWVRHPIYTAMLALAVGSVALVPTALTAAAVVLMAVSGDLRARAEERILLGAFGERYRGYAEGTRRFVPGVY